MELVFSCIPISFFLFIYCCVAVFTPYPAPLLLPATVLSSSAAALLLLLLLQQLLLLLLLAGHSEETGKTRVRLPSGARKTLPSRSRCIIGLVAGGGRIDKPLLKAGTAYHKYKVRAAAAAAACREGCCCWPRRGVDDPKPGLGCRG